MRTQAPDAKKFLFMTVIGFVFGAYKADVWITISDMRLAKDMKWEKNHFYEKGYAHIWNS